MTHVYSLKSENRLKMNLTESHSTTARHASVSVVAPARLHFGFIDMHGGLGRLYGSLGVALNEINTRLTVWPACRIEVQGPCRLRARHFAERLLRAQGIEQGVRMVIESAIPEHAGLGAGTQLGLSVSTAVAGLYGLRTSVRNLAATVERGSRSGIGVGAFRYGGFLVDGGRDRNDTVPPVTCRKRFPEEWRIILILDSSRTGLNGLSERSAFEDLPRMEEQLVGHLCRVVLMQVLPALADANLKEFSAGIATVQEVTGDYFSRFQGGRYSSPIVATVLDWFRASGIEGVGQSSWGPTGFAVVDSSATADKLAEQARAYYRDYESLEFKICRAQNAGASIQEHRSVVQETQKAS